MPASPEEATLERVANPHPGATYLIRFTCPEFTSICPITGQPDFAHLVIDYVPDTWIVESRVFPFMGGVHDATHPRPDATQRLILTGLVVMGGVEIKH